MGEMFREVKRGLLMGFAAAGVMAGTPTCNDISPGYRERTEELAEQEEAAAEKAERYRNQCSDGRYDYDARCVQNLEQKLEAVRESVYPVFITVGYTIEGGSKPVSSDYVWKATGILLEGGHVISAGHLVKVAQEELLSGHPGGVVTAFKIKSIDMYAGGKSYSLKTEWAGIEDFTIMELAEPVELCLPSLHAAFGDAGRLEAGSLTYSFSAINIPNTKEGHITNPAQTDKKFPYSYIRQNRDPGDEYRSEYFVEGTVTKGGDSGGPVIAFLDGEPELAGIACTSGGEVLKIGIVRRALDAIHPE